MFDGVSYMSAPIPTTRSIRHVTTFSVEVKTNASDGMLIWIGEVGWETRFRNPIPPIASRVALSSQEFRQIAN